MSDECSNPGTLLASIISCGSHRMSRLHVWVDQIMLPSGNLIAIGYSVILILTAGEPFIRKCEEAHESESSSLTIWMRCFVLNIFAALADCWGLPSITIFFHISTLDLNQGLLASFIFLLFARSAILCFYFAAVLLVELPPQGSVYRGRNVPIGMSPLA